MFHFSCCPPLFPFPEDIKLMILADTGDRPNSRNLVRKCTGEEEKVAPAQQEVFERSSNKRCDTFRFLL